MDTSHEQAQYVSQTQVQKIAPHLIQASEILQCTSVELRQMIERELMENPALESVESANDRCAECDLTPSICPNCPYAERRATDKAAADQSENSVAAADGEREEIEYEPDTEQVYDTEPLRSLSELSDPHIKEEAFEDAFDPLSLAPSMPSLRDHLLSRLRSVTHTDRDYKVCEYLVNNLDERGWLKIERTEAMVELSITEEMLDDAIAALQSCDPAGIGARDLRECLLLQLQQLEDEGSGNRLAFVIVDKHWDLLTQRRFDMIGRRTGATQAAVARAVQFIQSETTPAPSGKYRESWNFKPDNSAETIRPDVIISRTATGLKSR